MEHLHSILAGGTSPPLDPEAISPAPWVSGLVLDTRWLGVGHPIRLGALVAAAFKNLSRDSSRPWGFSWGLSVCRMLGFNMKPRVERVRSVYDHKVEAKMPMGGIERTRGMFSSLIGTRPSRAP